MRRILGLVTLLWLLAVGLGSYAPLAPADPEPLPQPTLYIINASTGVTDAELANYVPGLQLAIDQDFRRYWNAGVKLVISDGSPVPKNAWKLTIADNLDCFACGGYHTVTNGYLPYGEVLSNEDWDIALSHEVFEMLADPRTNRAIVTPDGCGSQGLPPTSTTVPCVPHWLEVADPVEAFSYRRPGADGSPVRISDFITERWYHAGAMRGPFDLMGKVKRPFQILPGGYEGLYTRR